MTVERLVRLFAGLIVAVSALFGMSSYPGALWVALFVGVMLFQSGFTNWCPMMTVLRWAGAKG